MLESESPDKLGVSKNRLERVDQWLDFQISSGRLAGASVLIGRHGRVGYFAANGLADQEQQTAFNRESIVRIFSMTKPVTTVAAMMLFERGMFQLDDPIARYLPEFKDTPVWCGANAAITELEKQATPITVKQLMNHTSGLTYEFMQSSPVDALYRDRGINFQGTSDNLEQMVTKLSQAPLMCQPGTQWNYSVATDVLGRLVEVWSGQNLRDFLINEILQPLGMHDTDFNVSTDNAHRFSAMYGPAGGGGLGDVGRTDTTNTLASKAPLPLKLLDASDSSSRYTRPTPLYSGGGGLTGSIDDYALFCQMILNGGELNGVRLLSPLTVDYMCTNHLPENRDMAAMGQPVWSETNYDGIGFGLGFAVVLDPVKAHTLTSVGECHWGGAASTFFWIDKKQGLFTILFTQLMPSSTYPLRRELRTLVYQSIVG